MNEGEEGGMQLDGNGEQNGGGGIKITILY